MIRNTLQRDKNVKNRNGIRRYVDANEEIDCEFMSRREVAELLGISIPRVAEIEASALKKIKRAFEKMELLGAGWVK